MGMGVFLKVRGRRTHTHQALVVARVQHRSLILYHLPTPWAWLGCRVKVGKAAAWPYQKQSQG